MARINCGRLRQRVDLLANGALKRPSIAPRQVGAANAALKKRVAHERAARIWKIKQEASRAMAGHVADFGGRAKRSQAPARLNPTINLDWLEPQPARKCAHDARMFVQGPVRGMPERAGSGRANDFRRALGMVPMAVGEPKLLQPAILRAQDRLDLGQNSFRSIDKHRRARSREQIRIGRQGSGR